MNVTLRKIDAFSWNGSAGNPAAVCYPSADQVLPPETMQTIARELRDEVREVGFFFPIGHPQYDAAALGVAAGARQPLYRVKYYSAEREVDFCGHATIAAMHDLARSGAVRDGEPFSILTNRGALDVYPRAEADAVFIRAPEPRFRNAAIPRDDTAWALGLDPAALDPSLPLSIVNAGLDTLLVPVSGLDAVLSLAPDFEVLKDWCFASGADIVEVFTRETVDHAASWRVRVFPPRMGYRRIRRPARAIRLWGLPPKKRVMGWDSARARAKWGTEPRKSRASGDPSWRTGRSFRGSGVLINEIEYRK
jgi:PhzF family phenazine biosynthesis protein